MPVPRRTRQQAQAQLEREAQDAVLLRDYARLTARLFRDAIDRLLDISDEEWQAAMDADAEREQQNTFQFEVAARRGFEKLCQNLHHSGGPVHKIPDLVGKTFKDLRWTIDFQEAQPWEPIVARSSDVMKLAHGATMRDDVAEQVTRGELTNIRARAYEKELKLQGQAVGCPEYRARLGQSEEWVTMLEQSTDDARSITTTYNRELANQINRIRKEVPTANRFVYAKRLKAWETNRANFKERQIVGHTTLSARSKAQADFYNKNGITAGHAILRPRTAVCPICQGWIDRGEVPVNVATSDAPPYHPSCPHIWDITTPKLPKDGCKNLWKPTGPPFRLPPEPPPVPVVPEPVPTQDNWTIVTKHPRSGQEFIPSDADVALTNSTLGKVANTVDVGDVEVVIGDVGGTPLGTVHGEGLININPATIRKAIADSEVDDAAFASWFQGTGRNYDALFEHTAAHESGHVWVNQKSLTARGPKTFTSGGIVKNPVMEDWVGIHEKLFDSMSAYGQYSNQPNESFADMFARYVLGRDMPPEIENWFMENVK